MAAAAAGGHAAALWLLAASAVLCGGVRASTRDLPHLLLLLDSSASMASQNRFEKMQVAVRGWIENFVPEGIKLSLWKFTNDAVEIKSSEIDSTSVSRDEIINTIPEIDSGFSCVSCAIETVLKKQVNNNFTLLLITDGNDKNLQQDLKELRKKIESTQCRIIAVLMGNSLTNYHLFEELPGATVTHVADWSTVLGLINIMHDALLTVTNVSTPINIYEEEFSENHLQSTFSIDSTVVSYTCINLYYWPYSMEMSVNLTTPSSENQQVPIEYFKHGTMKFCRLPKIVGQWKIDIFSSIFNKFIALQIITNKNVTDVGSDISFDCWIKRGQKHLSIWGSMHPGNNAIKDTKISVDIIAQDEKITKQELRHVYSENYTNRYLYMRKHLNIHEPGYYNARCWARGQLLQAFNTTSKSQVFDRVSWAGTFQFNASNKLSWPSEIDDLVASVETDEKRCTLTVNFTAPANATKYKLILSSTLYDIVSSKGMDLSTVPGKEGSKEMITVKIPSYFMSLRSPLYIAMIAMSEHNSESEISNIVLVRCGRNNSEIQTIESTEHSLRISTDVGMLVVKDYISSTIFVPLTNISNTSPSPQEELIDLVTTPHLSFNTSLALNRNKNGTSMDPESDMDETQGFTSNTSDISNSSTTVPSDNVRGTISEPKSNSLGVSEIVGIAVGVSLIIAVVAKLVYQNVYNRRNRSYQVASRDSTSFEPFHSNDDL